MMEKERGLLHLYCGDGKGKTTTAVGLSIRFAGAGKRVLLYQFMKNNTSSERNILEQIPLITCEKGKDQVKFSFQMTEEEKKQELKENNKKLIEMFQKAKEQEYDLLFLDETLYTIDAGLLSEELLIEELKKKPTKLEVVLTGRNPSENLIQLADYVSEIKKVKHPFEQGISSRKGVEY